jgi:Rho GTPase-activating protein 1
MHEVSLREASNRMNAYNLAVVLCPNLVKSHSPALDVMMCTVPGGPSLFEAKDTPSSPSSQANPTPNEPTTLGAVICICIQRYYEVFDEVRDRSEARPLPASQSVSSSNSASPTMQHRSLNYTHNDNDSEDIDDAMLVMPIGPNQGKQNQNQNANAKPPSAWGISAGNELNGGSTIKSRPGQRSVHTTFGDRGGGNEIGYLAGKARSMVSVENGLGGRVGAVGRGSISVGRSGTRKASGAGVEAIGVTAEGFFTPSSGVPSVP